MRIKVIIQQTFIDECISAVDEVFYLNDFICRLNVGDIIFPDCLLSDKTEIESGHDIYKVIQGHDMIVESVCFTTSNCEPYHPIQLVFVDIK